MKKIIDLTIDEKRDILTLTLIEAKDVIKVLSTLYIHEDNTFLEKEGIIENLAKLFKCSRKINKIIKEGD